MRRTYDTSSAYLLVAAPTLRELAGLRSSRLSGYGVAEVGLGHAAAGNLRDILKSRRPQVLLSIGFGGALASDLRTGDLVVSTTARTVQLPSKLVSMSGVHGDEAFEALALAGLRVTRGTILTVPEPLMSKQEKERQGSATGATIVDMESFWIAQEADRAGVPVVSVRTVLDELGHDLPEVVADITADGGKRELYHALRAMRNPANIGAMVPLATRSRKSVNATKEALRALLPVLTRNAQVRAVHR